MSQKPQKQVPNTHIHRRNLPHWERPDAIYFITTRLHGSLPKAVLERLKAKRDAAALELERAGCCEEEKNEKLHAMRALYFGKYDKLLDTGKTGPHWLKQPEIALIWKNTLAHFDNQRYQVICSTIMSNHVHFIIHQLTKSLSSIMHSLKSYSAMEANKVLRRTGEKFWQAESYDRIIRHRLELERTIRYVLNNPVKIGLVRHWADWRWNYLRPEYRGIVIPPD